MIPRPGRTPQLHAPRTASRNVAHLVSPDRRKSGRTRRHGRPFKSQLPLSVARNVCVRSIRHSLPIGQITEPGC